MNKKLFVVSTIVYCEVNRLSPFLKVKKTIDTGWIDFNGKLIYAIDEIEAVKKYENTYFVMDPKICNPKNSKLWANHSKSIPIDESNILVKYKTHKITAKEINPDLFSIDSLRMNMGAKDFKDWWKDNDTIEEGTE